MTIFQTIKMIDKTTDLDALAVAVRQQMTSPVKRSRAPKHSPLGQIRSADEKQLVAIGIAIHRQKLKLEETKPKTAAGVLVKCFAQQKSPEFNTRLFFGQLADGRFVVSSRFEYYVKTKDRKKAANLYNKLTSPRNVNR